MKVYFSVVCPYCGQLSKYVADRDTQYQGAPLIYSCDTENEGCGHYFVVKLWLQPMVEVQSIIEERDAYQFGEPEEEGELSPLPPHGSPVD